jgi:hypothetical protein
MVSGPPNLATRSAIIVDGTEFQLFLSATVLAMVVLHIAMAKVHNVMLAPAGRSIAGAGHENQRRLESAISHERPALQYR